MYIVMPANVNHNDIKAGDLILTSADGWSKIFFDVAESGSIKYFDEKQFVITKVYDQNEYNGTILDPNSYGKCVWINQKHDTEYNLLKTKLKKAEQQVESLKEELELYGDK
jgi:hypothetical protein